MEPEVPKARKMTVKERRQLEARQAAARQAEADRNRNAAEASAGRMQRMMEAHTAGHEAAQKTEGEE